MLFLGYDDASTTTRIWGLAHIFDNRCTWYISGLDKDDENSLAVRALHYAVTKGISAIYYNEPRLTIESWKIPRGTNGASHFSTPEPLKIAMAQHGIYCRSFELKASGHFRECFCRVGQYGEHYYSMSTTLPISDQLGREAGDTPEFITEEWPLRCPRSSQAGNCTFNQFLFLVGCVHSKNSSEAAFCIDSSLTSEITDMSLFPLISVPQFTGPSKFNVPII
ncbi:hypothetical protein TNCV_336731 [Trichonephila clavipes]|nr:hypothetical protein TNCV_336731 [Trichonephila clavipes]